jgi:phage-related protein
MADANSGLSRGKQLMSTETSVSIDGQLRLILKKIASAGQDFQNAASELSNFIEHLESVLGSVNGVAGFEKLFPERNSNPPSNFGLKLARDGKEWRFQWGRLYPTVKNSTITWWALRSADVGTKFLALQNLPEFLDALCIDLNDRARVIRERLKEIQGKPFAEKEGT